MGLNNERTNGLETPLSVGVAQSDFETNGNPKKNIAVSIESKRNSSRSEMVTLGRVTRNNIEAVRKIHIASLPIKYAESFYAMILENAELCRLAYLRDIPVGVVCCRLERDVDEAEEPARNVGVPENESPATSVFPMGLDTVPEKGGEKSVFSLKRLEKWVLPTLNWCNSKKDTKISDSSSKLRLHILTLGVLEPYRRAGIGRKLIEWVIQRCGELQSGKVDMSTGLIPEASVGSPTNVDEITLSVWTENTAAIRFYEKLGFEKVKLMSDYYSTNLNPPDAYFLSKKMSQQRVT